MQVKRHILCRDNDIAKDWDDLVFKSDFRGTSLALDGHPLYFSPVSSTDIMIRYSAPVKVNGKRTNLIFFTFLSDDIDSDGSKYTVFGVWDGYDENGLPSIDYNELKKGDKVQVVTNVVTEDGTEQETFGEEFVIEKDGGEITELPLSGKKYQYVFAATDIFGNTFYSDMATFEMIMSYDELLKNPLPDGKCAAKVTKLEPYDQ